MKGISVLAGDFGGAGDVTGSLIRQVRITDNVISIPIPGISLIGGVGGPDGVATDNVLTDVVVRDNRILKEPKQVHDFYEPGIRGIRIVGGLDRARRNRVTCVRNTTESRGRRQRCISG